MIHDLLDDLAGEVRPVDLTTRVTTAVRRNRRRRYTALAAASLVVVAGGSVAVATRLSGRPAGVVAPAGDPTPTASPVTPAQRYDAVWVEVDRFAELKGLRPDGTRADLGRLGPGVLGAADLSPDGTRLAWASPRGVEVLTLGEPAPRVYGGLTVAHPNGRDTARPAWSPDGRTIAVSDVRSVTPVGGTFGGFYLLDVATGAVEHVDHPHDDVPLAWSPDGTLLALTNATNGIDLVDRQGRVVRNLPGANLALTANHAWSPDGTRLVIGDYDAADPHSAIVDATTGEELSRLPIDVSYVWSDDDHVLRAREGVVQELTLDGRVTRTVLRVAAKGYPVTILPRAAS